MRVEERERRYESPALGSTYEKFHLTSTGSVPWPQRSSKPSFAPSAARGTTWFLMLEGFSNSLMVGVS